MQVLLPRDSAASMQDPAKTLQQVNDQLLGSGQSFPEVTLSDGSKVQTGTFGACLANIRRYNRGERGEVEDAIRLALPTLVSVVFWKSASMPSRKSIARVHVS